PGDLITIDIGTVYKGYVGDSAWSYTAGPPAPAVERLMAATRESLFRGIGQARPGGRLGDIGHAIQSYAEGLGYGVVREFTGHGVGQSLWEDPVVPHYGRPGAGMELREGMVIAIEPMITTGEWRARMDPDGWTARTLDGSLCAQYEHTVAITADGPVVLTEL
ncbi:MAG TPA: type I methionyl aminopeptidase, partial [Symbiobacteriaceae bacterium]|nr:type I methionyl aminopeptidase [Symbiobacteriaceae bacterium]